MGVFLLLGWFVLLLWCFDSVCLLGGCGWWCDVCLCLRVWVAIFVFLLFLFGMLEICVVVLCLVLVLLCGFGFLPGVWCLVSLVRLFVLA